MAKKIRVAINGFGRIGRMVLRVGLAHPDIEFVAVNDLAGADAARYLLKYDSAYGVLPQDVKVSADSIIIGKRKIKVLSEKEITNLPWKKLGVDVVVESTGIFTDPEKAKIHIDNGAKKVLISAPAKGEGAFFIMRGVNDKAYKKSYKIVSNCSCTTNSLASVINELQNKYGIKKGMFATVHSVTNDQRILDAVHKKDVRRGRAATFNIIPTTTGAAKAVLDVVPALKGKIHGIAYRVPTITGSVSDLNLELKKKVTKEEINSFLKNAANTRLKGILEYSEEPLVSSDIIGNPHSGIVDGLSTAVVDGNLVKLVVWYDNEWGFSNRMVEVIKMMGK